MGRLLRLALMAVAIFAQEIPLREFAIHHEARNDSDADVRFLLDPPAGKYGFIRSSGGHFVTSDGRRFRIWGVNISGAADEGTGGLRRAPDVLPSKEESPVWAAEFARLGINCVRIFQIDKTTLETARGLLDGNRNDTRVMDKEQLDRLDFFVSELKQRGIYTGLTLNAGRIYKEGDGVPDFAVITRGKAMTYIGDRLLELQREYARQLLTHYNPYTRSEYRNEPAVAIVELVNENSVLEFWLRNWLRGKLTPGGPNYQLDLTPYYERLLTGRYNEWLARRMSPPDLQQFRKLCGVKPDQPVPRLRREEFAEAPKRRFYTEASFYTEIESGFFRDMKAYLRDTLGVKSLITGTADHTYFIPGYPLLRSTSATMDILDAHVYWQHPAIYGARNTPMVNDPLHSTVVKLTRSVFAGKPFTVSEVNHPFPNDYGSEMIPTLAAYGAFQDWDGIFFYTFQPQLGKQGPPLVADPFDISQDPVKIAQLPAGALLFLRDVKAANQVVERRLSTEQVNESMRLPDSELPYYTPGFPLSIPLVHGSRVRCLDCEPGAGFAGAAANPLVSDTGELAWYTSGRGGLVTIETDRSQALIGFVRANGKAVRNLSADIRNDFCSITLSSLDGKPIARSARLLLTTGARAQNSGSKWDARRALFSEWGTAPTVIEPVTGWVMLRNIEGAVGMEAAALDGAGHPAGQPIRGRRMEEGWEIPVGEPPTTSYLIRMIR